MTRRGTATRLRSLLTEQLHSLSQLRYHSALGEYSALLVDVADPLKSYNVS